MMPADELMRGLPGEDLIREGLEDVGLGRCTIAACLVAMASPRLRRAGIISERLRSWPSDPEMRLYRLLGQSGGDAYSRYNSLVRRLVSFEQALDRRCRVP